MDNILEILVPLIFAAIYFFGNMFGKSGEDESAPPRQPRRSAPEGGRGDAAERQRNIQEEIRRKIMERRRAAGSPAPSAAPVQREQQGPPPLVPANRRVEEDTDSSSFSWGKSDDAYDTRMQAQLKRIEETKRRAEKLKQEAANQSKSVDEPTKKEPKSGRYFTGSVRRDLRNPNAARVAFIYGEVLSKPISLRKGESTVPGLS